MRHKIGSTLWDCYSYFYDFITTIFFKKARKRYIEKLCKLQDNERKIDNLLIIGVGTGHDLSFLPKSIPVTAVDYSPKMMERTYNWKQDDHLVELHQMDAHHLDFPDNHFQRILMPLIIAVTETPHQVLKEAERVLKPGGRIVVFDKFVKRGQKISPGRKFLNLLTNTFATDITIDFHDILSQTKLILIEEEPSFFFGFFKIFLLEKSKR